MSGKSIYFSANEEDRREFFGIDVSKFKEQEFSLKNQEEVARFNDLLNGYVYDKTHISFTAISLHRWYDKCMSTPRGGRLFTALIDLKITVAFLFVDSIKAAPDCDSLNREDDNDILADSALFRKRLEMLHKNIDLATRYRAFYDKYMGVLY